MAVSLHFQFKFLPFQCLLSLLFLAGRQLPSSSSSLFMFTVLSITTEGPNSKGGPEQGCGEGQKGSHGALHIAEPDTIETILQSSWWRIRFQIRLPSLHPLCLISFLCPEASSAIAQSFNVNVFGHFGSLEV